MIPIPNSLKVDSDIAVNSKRSLETISSNPTRKFGSSETNEFQEPQNKLAKPGVEHQSPNSWSAVFQTHMK